MDSPVKPLHVLMLAAALIPVGFALRDSSAGPLVGLTFLIVLGMALILRIARGRPALAVICAAALAARIVTALADHQLGLFPKGDQNGYLQLATWLAENWMHAASHDVPSIGDGVGGYVRLLAPLFVIFGPHVLLARFQSAIFGMLAVALVYLLGERLFGRNAGFSAALVFAFLPALVYFQSETLRDPAIILATIATIYFAIDGLPKQPWHRVGLAGAFIVVAILRPFTAIILGLPLGLLLLRGFLAKARPPPTHESSPALSGPPRPRHLRPAHLALPLAGAVLTVWLLGQRYLVYLMDLERLTYHRTQWALGGSAYLTDVQFNTPLDVILFAPVGAFFFLFTPFPWQVHNSLALIAAAEQLLVWYPLTILAIVSLRNNRHDTRLWILVLLLLFGSTLYGIIEGNVGTALRHRLQLTWVIALLATPAIMNLYVRLTNAVSSARSARRSATEPTRGEA